MCGIYGYINTGGNTSLNLKRFERSSEEILHHRGPDQSGAVSLEGGRVFLGHKRLSIQDLTEAGKQPMQSRDGKYTMVFNGEIYNHYELRARYLTNYQFNSSSDTETLIELFSKLGTDAFKELVGMWSLAIWDSEKKQIIFSRDRMGQKPLYYVKHKSGIIFSSEIKNLLDYTNRKVSKFALAEYLANGNYDHLRNGTFFEEVEQLEPRKFAIVELDGAKNVYEYWNLPKICGARKSWTSKTRDDFKNTVVEGVLSQLLSDVKVGATLSGGLDSSIICSIIAKETGSKFDVFTAQFEGDPKSELHYVNDLVKKYPNIKLHKAKVEKLNLERDLLETIKIQEEPFGDPSIIAHRYLVKEAGEQGVKVLLGGQGGDEISLGYPWMYERAISESISKLQASGFSSILRVSQTAMSVGLRILMGAFMPKAELKIREISRNRRRNWLSEDLKSAKGFLQLNKFSSVEGVLDEALFGTGLPHLTHYDDRSTMQHSIEGRMPFLDHRIIEFTSTLDLNCFYGPQGSKFILKDTFRDYLPQSIYSRQDKVGFNTPLIDLLVASQDWVKSVFKENMCIVDNVLKDSEILFGDYNLLNLDKAKRVFRILSLVIWVDEFDLKIS